MKQSRRYNSFILCAAIAMLTACATSPTPQTPKQIAAQVCPPLTAILDDLASPLVVLPIGAKADIDAASPIVTAICAANATVDTTSLQSLKKTALPAIVNAVESGAGITQHAKDNLEIAKIVFDAIVQ